MMRRAAALTLGGLALFGLVACGGNDPGRREAAVRNCTVPSGDAYVWIPTSTFTLGADARYPEEGPPRTVTVPGFWIARTEVSNADFAAFAAATGYVTMAEREPPVLPGAQPDMSLPGSAVFTVPTAADPRWWTWVPGAEWRHPSGPRTAITGKDREPVVQIAYDDALAYARWVGKALPSEEQWEAAARSGGADAREPVDTEGRPQANYYQGAFPARDLGVDGFAAKAPVGCFPSDRNGVHDLIGNVWEWTSAAADAERNVIKGGSYLCAANYCARYRPAARQFQERGLGTDHIGIRLIDPDRPSPRQRTAP